MRFIKNIFIGLTLLLGFGACQNEDLPTTSGEGKGRLVVGNVIVDVSTKDGVAITRAADGTFTAPDASELTYTLTNNTTGEVEYEQKEVPADMLLAIGNYTLKAVYGENRMGTIPYLYKSVTFDIEKGKITNLTDFTVGLACAIIRPNVTDDLLAQYKPDYTLELTDGTTILSVVNGEDYFVPAGKNYTLNFAGTNQIGESKSFSFPVDNATAKTRYTLNCTATPLPVFTLPTQVDGNAWSKHIYITPLTEANIINANGIATSKILSNMVYEISADGSTWVKVTEENGRLVAKGLTPATDYSIRARFATVVSSNTERLTTEDTEQITNGNMDTWSNTLYKVYLNSNAIYLYYPGSSAANKSWGTRNTLTMDGVENGSAGWTSNQRVAYRWNSCTIPTSDAVENNAAEIRTMGFANFNINSGTGAFTSRSSMASKVAADLNVHIGYLYTGQTDVTPSTPTPNKSGIAHQARPTSLTFNYKYAPYGSDNCKVYAKLYDKNETEIASTTVFTSNASKNDYAPATTLEFTYSDLQSKAASIFIMFQSGVNESSTNVQYIEGSYNSNPWSLDTFVGSVLKIDNVTLNYE